MVEITINNIEYKSTIKLNAVEQFLLSKRLVPVLDVLSRVSRNSGVDNTEDIMVHIAESISKMPDEDALYIIDKCLSGMQCNRDGVWTQIWNKQAKQPQYNDMDMSTMLQLTFAVLSDTLGSFMPAPGTASKIGRAHV